ncbi:S-adenosyl-L-methionine-dependent methyltransferase [Aspergillus novofumigatus IBT 16806]|uniref:S-adenosyl-L-methionine-dependent methyltransferase n=1 Tax=Aspergillus novofumigatus (strain IBT 16806) TaxID=1392255 RepID=A0A2I1CB39_ASPN1|nr:S-adenosyl-L-methionine-dependent methyltransferase [Aspergillus novofumigatus IBT 16806]PKX94845.1 S-adenosyl-L-methionine-dependent methyltransferase [Aspergillus novofumigatus IBT 16806]
MPAQTTGQGQSPVDVSIATEPNNLDAVPTLLKEITQSSDAFTTRNVGRKDLLAKCRTLVQALETPRETMIYHCWAQTGAMAGLNFGVDSGLWTLMAQNGDEPQKVSELAAKLGIDHVLLSRLMRHLSAMGYLIEIGVDEYRLTNYTRAMSIPAIGHGYLAMLSCTSAGPMRFHEFSRKRAWVNPTDAKDTAMMYAYGTSMNTFAWQQSLGYGTHFNDHMSGYALGSLPWMAPGFYPVKEKLIDGANTDPEAPFLVDIGGNVGHDLELFHTLYPRVPGKLILQDLPVVIGQIRNLDPAILRMEYDFHTKQPVNGARAYYMHNCLHDWPDDVCKSILAQVKAAMKPGYSRLLIHEHVIPETGAYWEATALDMVMLTLLSAQERTRAAWYNLIEMGAGLNVNKIWSGGKGSQSLIECELPINAAN